MNENTRNTMFSNNKNVEVQKLNKTISKNTGNKYKSGLDSRSRNKLYLMLWKRCSYKDIKMELGISDDTISRYKKMWCLI